ncbi:MAG: hypothetical protein RhofKO_34690 [Rhodothermales bacterium]
MAAEALKCLVEMEASSLAFTCWLQPSHSGTYERLQQQGARLILAASTSTTPLVQVHYRALRLGTLPPEVSRWLRPFVGNRLIQPTLAEVDVHRTALGTTYPTARITLCHVGQAINTLLANVEGRTVLGATDE